MPDTPVYKLPFESPGDQPGISVTGGSSGTSPILAYAVETELIRIDSDISSLDSQVTQNTSDIADLKPYPCKIFASVSQNIPNNSVTVIQFNSISYDPDGLADVANNRIVVTEGGIYKITAGVRISANANMRYQLRYQVNGSGTPEMLQEIQSPSGTIGISGSSDVSLSPGDFVTASVFQNSGVTKSTGVSGETIHLSLFRVSA